MKISKTSNSVISILHYFQNQGISTTYRCWQYLWTIIIVIQSQS